MRIVAIHTLHVTRHGEKVFCRIMDPCGCGDGVDRGLGKFTLNVEGGHVPVMAGITIVFFIGLIQEALPPTRIVGTMTIFTAVVVHRDPIRVRPWVRGKTIPDSSGNPMSGTRPSVGLMTVEAKGRKNIIHLQEFAVRVVMGIMAGGTL
jgi:hypothetical protein